MLPLRDDWAEFEAAGTTWPPDPGVRAQWHRGRPWYAVWLIRVHDPAILQRRRAAAAQVRASLAEVPDADTHVTVWVAGFPTEHLHHNDDVSRPAMEAIYRDLLADPPPSPRLVVGGVSVWQSSTSLRVYDPAGDLIRLRDRLAATGPELRFDAYQAHITIGTWSGAYPVGPLAEALRPLRELPPLPLSTSGLEWVELDATTPGAPLITRHHVPWSASPR